MPDIKIMKICQNNRSLLNSEQQPGDIVYGTVYYNLFELLYF
jgi:hypothetical protein